MDAVPGDHLSHADSVRRTLAGRQYAQDQLLPMLHAICDRLGFIPPAEVAQIAEAFNLSRAEVHGVLSFYPHFRSTARAAHVIELCRAEACRSMGADALLAHAERATGCRLNGESADRSFALQEVYCLGHCAAAPALTLDHAVHARVTEARFDQLLAGLEAAP